MDRCLDTLRQKSKPQISIVTYHTPENITLLTGKNVFGLSSVFGLMVIVGLFYFVVFSSNNIYAKDNPTKSGQIIATSTPKAITAEQSFIAAPAKSQISIPTVLVAPIHPTTPVVSASSHGGFENIYASAEHKYGVSRYILAAIHEVETGQSGDTSERNPSGATGPMQFLPNTFAAYAQSYSGGTPNITNVDDAIYTAANYLKANGAANGNVIQALYRYNHHTSYVNKVLAIARSYGYTG